MIASARAADSRELHLRHVHTGETIHIIYKRNGRYDRDALKKLDWFLRDWRKDEAHPTDPRLFDLIWRIAKDVGARQRIDVFTGYRSPSTNAMLRQRSRAILENSQHVQGHAIDFAIPGVELSKLRDAAL